MISSRANTGFGLVAVPRAECLKQSIMQGAEIEIELKETKQGYIHKSSPRLTMKLGDAAQNDIKRGEVWD